MPDQYGFDHLPDRGTMSHRCIEEDCGWPGHGVFVSQADRERHARKHVRAREREVERVRLANLAKGRKVKKQADRENVLAYGEDPDSKEDE